MSQPMKPDVPAAARLMEAARSLRLEAERLRRAHPPKRASSQSGEVDVAADGRVVALRILDTRLLPPTQWGDHLRELYRAATGTPADGAVVADLLPDDLPPQVQGLGPSRYTFPPGIDADAPPQVVLAQVNELLRRRFAAAEAASARVAELTGTGVYGDGEAVVEIGSLGQLLAARTSSQLVALPPEDINAALAEALRSAQDDLRRQTEAVFDEEN